MGTAAANTLSSTTDDGRLGRKKSIWQFQDATMLWAKTMLNSSQVVSARTSQRTPYVDNGTAPLTNIKSSSSSKRSPGLRARAAAAVIRAPRRQRGRPVRSTGPSSDEALTAARQPRPQQCEARYQTQYPQHPQNPPQPLPTHHQRPQRGPVQPQDHLNNQLQPHSSSHLDKKLKQKNPSTRQYVAVDAATQYSPMDFNSPVGITGPPLQTHLDSDGATLGATTTTTQPASITSLDPSTRPRTASSPTPEAALASSPPNSRIISHPTIPSNSPVPTTITHASQATKDGTTTQSRRRESPPLVRKMSISEDAALSPKRVKSEAPLPKSVPRLYEHCAVGDLVVLISHMIAELIETNDALALSSGSLTRFHSRTAPGISVLDYLHRLARHATLTPPILLSMVYYIDRLCALYPEFTINTLTVHRFLITAATVASKGLSDAFWNNSTYARVGGVRLAELKLLELEFLYRVDWRIVPNPEVLVAYYQGLVQRHPKYMMEGENGDDGDNKRIE